MIQRSGKLGNGYPEGLAGAPAVSRVQRPVPGHCGEVPHGALCKSKCIGSEPPPRSLCGCSRPVPQSLGTAAPPVLWPPCWAGSWAEPPVQSLTWPRGQLRAEPGRLTEEASDRRWQGRQVESASSVKAARRRCRAEKGPPAIKKAPLLLLLPEEIEVTAFGLRSAPE